MGKQFDWEKAINPHNSPVFKSKLTSEMLECFLFERGFVHKVVVDSMKLPTLGPVIQELAEQCADDWTVYFAADLETVGKTNEVFHFKAIDDAVAFKLRWM